MDFFDSDEAFFLSILMGIAGIVGAAAGFRGGKHGTGLPRTMLSAVVAQVFAVFAVTAILAAAFALPGVRRVASDHFAHKPAPDGFCMCVECMPDLLISEPSPPIHDAHGRNLITHHDPKWLYEPALTQGAVWGFLAPVFALAGALPAAIGGFITYNLGAARRAGRELF